MYNYFNYHQHGMRIHYFNVMILAFSISEESLAAFSITVLFLSGEICMLNGLGAYNDVSARRRVRANLKSLHL